MEEDIEIEWTRGKKEIDEKHTQNPHRELGV